MTSWAKVAAVIIMAVSAVVLIYAILTPEESTGTTDHMGMSGGHMMYSSGNVGLIALSAAAIVVSLMIIALWKEYEPLPPSMLPSAPLESAQHAIGPTPSALGPPPVEEANPDAAAAHNYLVLRLLTGDERTMYKAIMDSEGGALQKDLIARTRMSNAKVSRVLDRLSAKGIVTKERYGATNRIRIKLDR